MNRLKTIRLCFAFLLLTTLWSVATVHAQSDTCEIDVSDAVVALLQAQASASSGDMDAGLVNIASARVLLAEITSACTTAGIEPGLVLGSEFAAPNNTFVVNYPADWFEGSFAPNPTGGGTFMGNSPDALSAVNTAVPALEAGQQALAIAVGTAPSFEVSTTNPTLEEVVRMFSVGALNNFEQTSELEYSTVDDRSIGRIEFRGEAFEAVLVGVQVENSDQFAVVVGISALGELDAMREIADAVALSVR